jgi:hypothetical protein
LRKWSPEAGTWWVCNEYEIRDGCICAKCPSPIWGTRMGWKTYRPLEVTPDLFLKLARLHEKSDFEEASLAFSHKYGLPGGRNDQYESWLYEMDLSLFREETKRAWGILKMYEAVLNRDWEAAKLHRSEHLDELKVLDLPGLGSSKDISREEVPGLYLEDALLGAVIMVEKTVKKLCRLGSIFTKRAFFPEVDPAGVKGVWKFNNLLGAAYLQMYWLMTSGGDIARCEHCGRVMSLARPHPEGRKRRRDKRFCDEACRQAHHRSKKKPKGRH